MGLTGPTGSGKTTACSVAEDNGFFVINCDKTARKATEDGDCLAALAAAFGQDILDENGALDRAALAKKAFSDSGQTELLNKTIFPFITRLIEEEIALSDRDKILLDAPTLFESGVDSKCNAVIAVLADKETRLKRILQRDSIDEAAAQRRMNAGKTDEFYKSKTAHIIYNDGDEQSFVAEFSKLLNLIGGNKYE